MRNDQLKLQWDIFYGVNSEKKKKKQFRDQPYQMIIYTRFMHNSSIKPGLQPPSQRPVSLLQEESFRQLALQLLVQL